VLKDAYFFSCNGYLWNVTQAKWVLLFGERWGALLVELSALNLRVVLDK